MFFVYLWFPLLLSGQYTMIPDPNFEQVLIDMNVDDTLDGRVLTASIDTVRQLQLSYKNISDLTGIQDFSALEVLSAAWTPLTRLEISNLNQLNAVYLEYSNLNQLLITGCPQLEVLSCHDNFIDNINITGNTNLKYLYIFNNQITQIDLSTNISLVNFIAFNNLLASLDFSNHVFLEDILVYNNDLSHLTLPLQGLLTQLVCADNPQLSGYLDLSWASNLNQIVIDNTAIEKLNIRNGNNPFVLQMSADNCNDLTCVVVDDSTATYINNWNIPNHTQVVERPESCENMHTAETSVADINAFPVPANHKLFIKSKYETNDLEVDCYDLSGKLIYSAKLKNNNHIDTTHWKEGTYILKIKTPKSLFVTKVLIAR